MTRVIPFSRSTAITRSFGITRGLEVRGVDDLEGGLERVGADDRIPGVVELLLHAGDVRVGLLDDEAGRGPEFGVVPDEAVHHHHVLLADVGVLHLGQLPVLLPGDGLVGVVLRGVGDHVGAALAAGGHLGVDVQVLELRPLGVGHPGRELPEFLGGGVHDHVPGLYGKAHGAFHLWNLLGKGPETAPGRQKNRCRSTK